MTLRVTHIRFLTSVALLWGTLFATPEAKGQQNLEGLTFKDALQSCIEAVGSGDLQAAADLFQSLELTFGSEDEYLAKEAQNRILPMKGLAELGAGRFGQAADTLDAMQEAFPQSFQQNASLLYGLAQAHKGAGNHSRAREVLALYRSRFAGTVEASLAHLEIADLYFRDELIEEGIASIDEFSKSGAPDSLKMQGQLKAVQACLNNGQMDAATERMLRTTWSITSMPELAQLAFSALRCGEFSMARGNYGAALSLFQLVPPKSQLIRLQKEKLTDLGTRILSGRSRALISRNRHQQSYLTALQQQLSQQLEALENADDYTPMFYLHYGQCLLFDSQFYKAWLVFEYLALNEDYEQSVREEAHYRWVVCAHQLADWEEALTIARNFVDRYPDSKLAPQALYLIAKAHLEQRRYPESIEVLSDLISKFPDHPLHGRWLFTRGFNQIVLEAYESARIDFNSYAQYHSGGSLIINSRLWNALTYFFERDYPAAIEKLTELLDVDPRHPLYPEVLYRLASAYYSAREYDPALETISSYLEKFHRHQRADEARVLRGDILMGNGSLEEAISSFDSVSSESPDMYLYSLFQRGKILRAQENYQDMVDLFQRFLENDLTPKIRVSEALYWLGWAYQQEGRTDLAYPVFENALAQYGNDTEAGETQSILQALEKLKRRQESENSKHTSELVKAKSFESWLESEIAKAERESTLTYLSRLVLYQDNRYGTSRTDGNTLIRLAEFIPMDQMDPEALGKIGLALLENKSGKAKAFLAYLVESFPKSSARAMGYLGLARLADQAREFDAARSWLTKSAEQVPVHPNMNETQLLMGSILSKLHEYEPSIETYEKLLRLKSARGRPHARALAGIAEAHRQLGENNKAIAYYQRIFNMYRAYPDLVSKAYLISAELFESMDMIPEAVKTLEELLSQKHLIAFPEWKEAESKLASLLPLLPEKIEEVPINNTDDPL